MTMPTDTVRVQVHPHKFFQCLRWIDGQPLWPLIDPYRRDIFAQALFTFREDGSPLYRRALTSRAKKNAKTLDAVLAALYKLVMWRPAGVKDNQIYFVASDMGQADDDLDLAKKLVRCNAVLDAELTIKVNVIERRDGKGFIEILPSRDADGLHGKTYIFLVVDELHTQRDYRVLEGLELDRTRPDAMQWFASYASIYRQPGVPLNDILKQHAANSDPRLYVSWYSGTIEEANPSLNFPLGPRMEDILDAQRSLPSWSFRRLYTNLPGQPDGSAFVADVVETSLVHGRLVLPPDSAPPSPYCAFVDMSGGGADDSTLAIAHLSDAGRVVLDLLMDQGGRDHEGTFDPSQTVKTFAAVCKQYGCDSVTGDRYAGEWPRQAFAKEGIDYQVSDFTRSELYARLEPLLNSGEVELLDQPKLFAQLIGLIRKGEKIDHPPGEHDDHSNAAAGAVIYAHLPKTTPGIDVLDWPTHSGPTFRERTSWSLLR